MSASLWLLLAGIAAAGDRVEVPTTASPERLALIIANNRSRDPEVRPLRFADDDGARFFELLTSQGFSAQLYAVLDADTAEQYPAAAQAARPPTWERLERATRELGGRVATAHAAGREVELFVSFSGHGAVGARGVPYLNLLDRRLYRGDFFNDLVAAVGADFVHLVIDACRARDFVDARGGPDGPEFDRELSLFLAAERRVAHPEIGVVVAESADGETHEWSRTRSGIFAHEVLSGLAGGADINGDGLVEYSELHAFIAAANHGLRDPRARLRVTAQPPALNPRRPLIRLGEGPAVERLRTPAAGGRYTIEDDRGVRWVDVNLAAGQQTMLYLPRRERFYVIDVSGAREAAFAPAVDRAVTALASLSFAPLAATTARGSIAEALASDLFRIPYGAEFYRGFIVAARYPSAEEGAAVEPALAFKHAQPASTGAAPSAEEAVAGPLVALPRAGDGRFVEPSPPFAAGGPLSPMTPPPASEVAIGWPAWRVLRWGGAAILAGGLIGAGVTGYSAAEKQDGLASTPQLEARDEVRSIRRLALVADLSLVVALIGGGALGASYLVEE